jgi:hypothetical protein
MQFLRKAKFFSPKLPKNRRKIAEINKKSSPGRVAVGDVPVLAARLVFGAAKLTKEVNRKRDRAIRILDAEVVPGVLVGLEEVAEKMLLKF